MCIASLKSTEKIDNKEFEPEFLNCFESELVVRAVLKGDPKLDGIRFIHYKYKRGVNTLGNGPSFAVLRDVNKAVREGEEDKLTTYFDSGLTFLFFLRLRPDGTYGPVSGDSDADLSVARLIGYADEE